MYKPLCPCVGCSRHVLATERVCPFCGAAMPEDFSARVRPEAPRGLSRMAAIALGTTLALGACSDTVTGTDGSAGDVVDASVDTPADAPGDEGGLVPLYGKPPPTDVAEDLVDDDGAPATEYGGPVFDAGFDDGSPAGMYGGPPPIDASRDAVDDEGGSIFLYGAPPPPDAEPDGR